MKYKKIPESTKEKISNQCVDAKVILGKKPLKLREEHHYKQGDVAEAIGISRPTLVIMKMENAEWMCRLSRNWQNSITYLLTI